MQYQEVEQLSEVLRSALLRTILGVARNSVIVPGPDGRVERFHRTCSGISGLERAEFLDRSRTTGDRCGTLSAQVPT